MAVLCQSLDALYPPMADIISHMDAAVNPDHFERFETYRSVDTQLEYWKKGRTLINGVWVITDSSVVITKAMPGDSLHAYGLATDYVPRLSSKHGLQFSWDDYDLMQPGKQPVPWKVIGAAAAKYKLTWGGLWTKFPDLPHVQTTFGANFMRLKQLLFSGGIPAVWKYLDTIVKPQTTAVSIITALINKPPVSENTVQQNAPTATITPTTVVVQQPPELLDKNMVHNATSYVLRDVGAYVPMAFFITPVDPQISSKEYTHTPDTVQTSSGSWITAIITAILNFIRKR